MGDAPAAQPPDTDVTGLGELFADVEAVDGAQRAQLLSEVEAGLFGRAPTPLRAGRYQLNERLGGGGQGNVYAAYDPELDRRVAVKLLRSDARDDPDAHGRLLREANALAQLADPHVVGVNDVGECAEGIFIVTELVEGSTLGQWLHARSRDRNEILEVFLQAGAGLAAAHARGLSHRDFKPANVLVGADGRVRLADFGLARAADAHQRPGTEPSSSSPPAETSDAGSSQLSPLLTRSGIAMGTPAYMAPEQWRGDAGPASDQFAFGVALYEALYGERPFDPKRDGGHFREGAAKLRPPGRSQPAWLRRVLTRSLSLDPADRFDGMSALLRALGRRRVWPQRTVAGLALGVVALAVLVPSSEDPCEAGRSRLHAIWDDQRRETLQRDLSRASAPGTDISGRVVDRLDAWSGQWTQAQRGVCEAASDAEIVKGRLRCLEDELDRFAALVDILESARPSVASHAAEAVARLPAPHTCTAVAADDLPHPTDPDEATRVDALRRKLARVDALHHAAQQREALSEAHDALATAEAIGFAPVRAEALLRLGMVLEAMGDYGPAVQRLTEAHDVALSARHERVRARAAVVAVFVHGHRLANFEQARIWTRYAQAAMVSVPPEDPLQVLFPSNVGAALIRSGDYVQARARLEHAQEVCERICTEEDMLAALVHNNLAVALIQLGEDAAGLEHLSAGREISQARLGREHPNVLTADGNTVALLTKLGRLEPARRLGEELIELESRVHGPEHSETAAAYLNLGSVYHRLARDEDSVRATRRSLAIRERAYGPGHPTALANYNALGLALSGLGRHEEALDAYAKAVDIATQTWGPQHVEVGPPTNNSVRALLALERVDEALARIERVLAIYDGTLSDDDMRYPYAYTSAGLVHLARGDPAAAREPLTRALAQRERDEHDPVLRARTRFALARAEAGLGDHGGARRLAEDARRELDEAGPRGDAERREVEAWLQTHGSRG